MQGLDDHAPAPAWLEAAFLEEFLGADPTAPVEHFQACFPGHEHSVTELFARHAAPAARVRHIGRYRLEGSIGRGGQGTVYRAYDPELERHVALKVGHPRSPEDSASALRLVREARVGARLAHPGICPVLDHGSQDGTPYVVMPFLEGWSLRQLLEFARSSKTEWNRRAGGDAAEHGDRHGDERGDEPGEPSDEAHRSDPVEMARLCDRLGLFVAGDASSTSRSRQARAVAFVEKVARAMSVAHAGGIIHRDLKPANILVRPDGEPVVLDLGLAKDENSTLPTLTGDHDLLGTPAYVAPEQLRCRGGIGPGVDVWALGVVLTECLTGERPFPGPSRDQLYRQILEDDPRPLREGIGPVTRDLQVLVDTALQKDPGRRYASVQALADDLLRFHHQLPIRARAPGPAARLRLWARRKPMLAAAVSGLFVTLAATVITMVFLLREQARGTVLMQERYAAMRAVSHDIVFDLVERLESVPGTAEARRRLAEHALAYLDILRRAEPGDRRLKEQEILARLRLGDALGNPNNQDLGQTGAALAMFEKAREDAVQLARGWADETTDATTPETDAATSETDAAHLVARCDRRIATTLIALGRFAEAQGCLQRVREHFAGLVLEPGAGTRTDGGSLRDLELLFTCVADLANCAARLGRPKQADELEREAIALADRIALDADDSSDSGDPAAMECVAQTTQVACVLRERQGRADQALALLQQMHPRVVALADRHPERERLQHSAIVFGAQIGRLLLAARQPEAARPVYTDTLGRLDRARQHGLHEDNNRLRLVILFEYGQGLGNLDFWEEGLRHLAAAAAGCEAILGVTPEHPTVQKLLRHVTMQQSLIHSSAGRPQEARRIIDGLAGQYLQPDTEWTEERLRDRGRVMRVQVQVLVETREFDAAREVLAREERFFRASRSGGAVDEVQDAIAAQFAHTSARLERFLKGLEPHASR
jgi:serine/threonine protein kinase